MQSKGLACGAKAGSGSVVPDSKQKTAWLLSAAQTAFKTSTYSPCIPHIFP